MERILIRYLTGPRANQVDEFPVDAPDLIAGRDPLAAIHFDPEQDDLVSRQHLKITRDAVKPDMFRLIDLESRNGTYVNHRRVYGSTFLSHNDLVQVGAAGPQFRFELDPIPTTSREAPQTSTFGDLDALPPTRESFPSPSGTRNLGESPRPVGRATVERMFDETFGLLKRESSKAVWVGLLALIAVLLVGFVIWSYMRRTATAAAIAQQENKTGIEQLAQQVPEREKETNQLIQDLRSQVEQLRRSNEEAKKALERKLDQLNRNQRELNRREQNQRELDQQNAQVRADTQAYSILVDQVSGLIDQSKFAEALDISRKMMQLDPNRYEGYLYGGVSALKQQKLQMANSYLGEALTRAPQELKTEIQSLLARAPLPGGK